MSHNMIKITQPMQITNVTYIPNVRQVQVSNSVQSSVDELAKLVTPLVPDNVKAFPAVPIHEPAQAVKAEPDVEAAEVEQVVESPEASTVTEAVEVEETAKVEEAVPVQEVRPIQAAEDAGHATPEINEEKATPSDSIYTAAEVAPINDSDVTPEFVAAAPEEQSQAKVNVKFMGDTTITDGESLPAGAEFDKAWQCQFTGIAAGQKLFLRFQGGESFGVAGRTAVEFTLADNDLQHVRLQGLKVPRSGDTFYGVWRFVDEEGQAVGDKLWIELVAS